MRTAFFPRTGRDARTDVDTAESVLLTGGMAGIAPALLMILLESLAGAAGSSGGSSAAVLAGLFAAGAELVRWIGLLVLAGMAVTSLALCVLEHRRARGAAPELSSWALAEAYAASALVTVAGIAWLAWR